MSLLIDIPPARAAALSAPEVSFDRCWFRAPSEKSPEFLPVFAEISVAVQAALRRAIPAKYLCDLNLYRDSRMAYPLLAYAASRPYRAAARADFTYDILNSAHMHRFYYTAAHRLPAILRPLNERLCAAGMRAVAADYHPSEARYIVGTVDRLKICRRRLEALMFSETMMVNHLLAFAGSRSLSVAARKVLVEKCRRVWLVKLRRMYARKDFTSVAPEVLAAATHALRSALKTRAKR
jgi:hypothetical protein